MEEIIAMVVDESSPEVALTDPPAAADQDQVGKLAVGSRERNSRKKVVLLFAADMPAMQKPKSLSPPRHMTEGGGANKRARGKTAGAADSPRGRVPVAPLITRDSTARSQALSARGSRRWGAEGSESGGSSGAASPQGRTSGMSSASQTGRSSSNASLMTDAAAPRRSTAHAANPAPRRQTIPAWRRSGESAEDGRLSQSRSSARASIAGSGRDSLPRLSSTGSGRDGHAFEGGAVTKERKAKKDKPAFANVKRNKAFFASLRLLQAVFRRNKAVEDRRVYLHTVRLFVYRFRMRRIRRRYIQRVEAGSSLNNYAKGYALLEAHSRYRRAAWLSTTLAVRTTHVELHRARLLAIMLLQACCRRDRPRLRYSRRIAKVRFDILRYNNLAGTQKSLTRFNMRYTVGSGFKEIKIKALQSAAGTPAGYLLNSLNTYQRLAMINSVDIGEQQRNLKGVASPRLPSSPRPGAQASRSPLAERVTASRGPIALLHCMGEALSPHTPFPRPPPKPIPDSALLGLWSGGHGPAPELPPLVGSESSVESASPSHHPGLGYARGLFVGTSQGQCKADHTGLPVIDQHRASMRPDGTHVAIDVSYKYEQVAAASAEVRRRAADALAASTQLAGRHAVELLWDEVAAQEARNAVQDIVDAAERDKREARRRAAEEFEADSSEYVTFGLESANRLPKGSWTYMEVVVLGHKPFRTHVASGDACVWGEGVKLRIAKGPERKAVVSLIGERSDTGDGVTTLLGTRTVSLDDIPLGEGGPIEVVDEVSPPQAAKQEVMDELVIEVIEGQNLPAADRGGTSDPIAMVKFEGAMAQTRSLKKTVNPQWREVFVLPLAPSTSQTRTARIDVFDKNFSFVGSGLGDFLGGVDVPVTVIAGGAAVDQWLELEGEGARGRIHVRMKVKENAVEREILPQIKLLLSRQKEVMVPAERRDDVYVSVVRCEGMAAEAAKQAVLFLDQEMRRLPIREGQVDSEQYAHWEVLLEGSSLSVWLSSERVPHTAYPRVPQKRVGAEGRVPLARIERGVEAEVWVDLGEGGRVLLRMARMAKCTQRMEVVCLVKSARGLAAADRGGTSDPYAEVQVGKSLKKTTKVVPKTLDPVWNETFTLPLEGAITARQDVTVDIFDHDLVGPSDFLGRARIDAKTLRFGVPLEEWIPLEGRKAGEEVKGYLNLRLLKQDRTRRHEYVIEVMGARKLTAADRGGTSDPFVVVACEGKKFKTKVIKTTLTPEWNETFYVAVEEDLRKATFEVYDYNTFGRNTFLGAYEADLAKVTIGEKSIQKWHPLRVDRGSKAGIRPEAAYKKHQATTYGELGLRISRQYLPEGPERVASAGASADDEASISVTVVEARGLVAADRGGTSDPFVLIYYPTLKKPHKTAVVSKTLSPVWDESFTVQAMPGRNDGVVQGSAADGSVVSSLSSVLSGVSGGASLEGSGRHQQMDMVFEVYDYDLIGANDFLGRVVVPLASLKPDEPEDRWIALQPREGKKDEVTGEIHLKILFKT